MDTLTVRHHTLLPLCSHGSVASAFTGRRYVRHPLVSGNLALHSLSFFTTSLEKLHSYLFSYITGSLSLAPYIYSSVFIARCAALKLSCVSLAFFQRHPSVTHLPFGFTLLIKRPIFFNFQLYTLPHRCRAKSQHYD
jgi:hypothetical protein